MKIELSEHGCCLPDVLVREFVERHIKNLIDIHTSNIHVIDWVRATLKQIPLKERPEVKWIFYGQEVHFNDDLKSEDAWSDPRTDITEPLWSLL